MTEEVNTPDFGRKAENCKPYRNLLYVEQSITPIITEKLELFTCQKERLFMQLALIIFFMANRLASIKYLKYPKGHLLQVNFRGKLMISPLFLSKNYEPRTKNFTFSLF